MGESVRGGGCVARRARHVFPGSIDARGVLSLDNGAEEDALLAGGASFRVVERPDRSIDRSLLCPHTGVRPSSLSTGAEDALLACYRRVIQRASEAGLEVSEGVSEGVRE